MPGPASAGGPINDAFRAPDPATGLLGLAADGRRLAPAAWQGGRASGNHVRPSGVVVRPPGVARAATALFVLLFAAGCSAAVDTGSPSGSRPGTTGALLETTAPNGASRELRMEAVTAGAPGQGPAVPRVVLAPSAAVLSEAIGGRVPDRGEGTYLLAYWGRKPTGGYSLVVESARIEGERVTVRLALKEPPVDAILTQAFTYPYVLVVLGGLDPRGKEFVFEEVGGRRLGWPVRRAGGTVHGA